MSLSEHAATPMLAAAHRTCGLYVGSYGTLPYATDLLLPFGSLRHLQFRLVLNFFKGTLGEKRSAPNWAVLRECVHEPLHFYWFRAAVKLSNGLLSSYIATLKQAIHSDLKIVPRAKTSWASDILRAFEGLQGCDTYKQAFLQGLPICYSYFTADLSFRMRKV